MSDNRQYIFLKWKTG